MKKNVLFFVLTQTGFIYAASQMVVVSNTAAPAIDAASMLEVRKPGVAKGQMAP